MDLVNVALLFIAIGIFALIPIGCRMTRGHRGKPGAVGSASH